MASSVSLTGSALRGILWMSWGKAGRAVLQLIVLAALARLVLPADFGLVTAALVVIEFATIFSHIGLGKGLVQHPALRAAHVAVAFHTSVLLGVVLAAVTWLFAVQIAVFFRIEALVPILRVLALSFPLKALGVVPESLLQRDLRFRWLANRELISYAVGYGAIGVALAAAGWGAWALVSAHLAQTAANTLLLLIARPMPLNIRPERQAFSDLLYFSGGYTLGRMANQFALQGDSLVVGRWLGPVALGLYGRALQLVAVPANILGDILDSVLFPTMARAQEDTPRLAAAYRRGISLVALVMLPASVACFLLAPEIIGITLGAKWSAAITPFRLLALGLFFRTSLRMSDALARAGGFVYHRAWRQGIYAAFVVAGAVVGQHWGLASAAAGVLLALGVTFFLMAQLSLQIAGMEWGAFMRAHCPALLLAGSLALAMQSGSALARLLSLSPAVSMAVAFAAAGVTVTVLVWSCPRRFLGEDGLWMVGALRVHFPALQRFRVPAAIAVWNR